MTNQQKKMLDLLMEFHDICEKNGLKYYLIGNQLLYAAQNGAMHGYEVEIAMFHKDWEKFKEITAQREDREIESFEDGGLMPGFYFRYVDKNTLLLNLDRYDMYAKPGIAVNIYLIRSKRKKTALLNSAESRMAEVSGKGISAMAAKMVFPYLTKLEYETRSKGKNTATALKEAFASPCEFPKDFWTQRTRIVWMGRSFYTVSNYKEYLKKRFGKNWEKAVPNIPLENYRCIFSITLPYAVYMRTLLENNLFAKEFRVKYDRYLKEYEPYKKMLKDEQIGWDKTIFAAGERFRLWKKYMPLKERAQELMDSRRFDEAELLLKDYLTVLEKYLPLKITVCFDQDYLEMAKVLYALNGQSKKIADMKRYLKKADLIPIKVARQEQ